MEFIEPSCVEFGKLLSQESGKGKKYCKENAKFANSLKPVKLYRWDAAVTSGFALAFINGNINDIILLLCEYRELMV